VAFRCSIVFGQVGHLVEPGELQLEVGNASEVVKRVLCWAEGRGLCKKGQRSTILHGTNELDTHNTALMSIQLV